MKLRGCVAGLVLIGLTGVPAVCPLTLGDDAPTKAASTAPLDVFKARGLTKTGFLLVSAKEAEVHTATVSVRGLKQKVAAETMARSSMDKAIKTSSDAIINYQSQLAPAYSQMQSLRTSDPTRYNQFVPQYNAKLQQFKAEEAKLDELKKKQAKIGDSQAAYLDAVLSASTTADAATAAYASLAEDAELKGAMAEFNRTATQQAKLGPTAGFQADVAYIKKCAGDVEAEAIPVTGEHGVPEVEVLLNGKVTQTMIWDSGASLVTLSGETAAKLGLHATAKDKTIKAVVADGRTVEAKLVTLDSIRVGAFTVRDVPCAIPADGKGGTDLLGDAFQSHFMCRLDMHAGVLRLTPLAEPDGSKETVKGSSAAAGQKS